jgi:hypothetical protein
MPDPKAMIPIEQARPCAATRSVSSLKCRSAISRPAAGEAGILAGFASWLLVGQFMQLVLAKFGMFVEDRFKGAKMDYYNEGSGRGRDQIRARAAHRLAEKSHHDAVLSAEGRARSRTSARRSICRRTPIPLRGRPASQKDGFLKLHTMPFKPNSLFAFVKGDNSFHGVEPVTDPDTKRWLLLYDVYTKFPQVQPT